MTLKDYIDALTNFIGISVVGFLSACVLVAFFWGLIRYLWVRATGARYEDEKGYLFKGIIAVFVVFSISAIIAAILGLFK